MRLVFASLVVLHGLIHLMGFVKAFGIVAMPQLTQPISRPMGAAWLSAAVLVTASGVLSVTSPRWWWWVGGLAVVLSQLVISSSWTDARFGTIANAILLAGVVHGALAWGPTSFRAQYEREVDARLARTREVPQLVTEHDLAPLPEPVRTFLRRAGAVGQPRVQSYSARWRGRIRSGPTARWMPLAAEQHNFADDPARYFWMDASMLGLPIDGLHRYAGEAATMKVKALSLVTVADASGPELTRAETVTLLNDMCMLAPATLLGPGLAWEGIDQHRARVTFTNAGHSVAAELVFDDQGDLVDFVSDDRSQAVPGKPSRRLRWSTPLRDHRAFGPVRVAGRGSAVWHAPEGTFAYIELELLDLRINPTRAESPI